MDIAQKFRDLFKEHPTLNKLKGSEENDQEDPTEPEVFTDFHFWGRSVAHEAYHLSHGSYQ